MNAIAAAREMLRAVGASNVGNAWPIRLGIDNYIGQEATGTAGSPRREEPALVRTPVLPDATLVGVLSALSRHPSSESDGSTR